MQSRTAPWCVLSVAWLAFLLSYVDRFAWPPVMAQASRDLGLSGLQAGSYMSAFFAGYVLTQLPAGFLIDRLGYRRVLLGCFALMGTFTALMSSVGGYEMGFVFRFMTGVGSGAVFAASVAAVCAWFEPHRRALAMGLFQMGSSFGLALANFALPMLASAGGWRQALLIAGCLPLVCLIPAYLLLGTAQRGGGAPTTQSGTPLLTIARNPQVLTIAGVGFFALWATIGTGSWANTYMIREFGLSAAHSGWLMTGYGLITIVSMPGIGWLADRFPRHRAVVLVAALLTFAALLVAFGFNRNPALLPLLVPCLGAAALGYYPLLSTMLGEAVEPARIGITTALVNAVWQMGAFLAPIAVGFVLDRTHDYSLAFDLLAVAPVCGVLLLLAVHLRARRALGAEAAGAPTNTQRS